MILQERVDSSFGEKNSKLPLRKLKVDYNDSQFCICQTRKEDFNYTQKPANLLLVVLCIKFRMGNKMNARGSKELLYHRIGNMWFGN